MSGHLLYSGVRREPWNLAHITGQDNIDKLYLGKAHCIVQYDRTENVLIAVANDQPGNGDFGRLMDYLEWEAHDKGKDFVVAEIWNDGLREHLKLKRGYRDYPRANGVIKVETF